MITSAKWVSSGQKVPGKSCWGESTIVLVDEKFSILFFHRDFFNLCADQNKSFTGWMACAVL